MKKVDLIIFSLGLFNVGLAIYLMYRFFNEPLTKETVLDVIVGILCLLVGIALLSYYTLNPPTFPVVQEEEM